MSTSGAPQIQLNTSDYPNLDLNTPVTKQEGYAGANGTGIENLQNKAVNAAQSTMDTVKNHPVTQQIANGPVAQNAKAQAAQTQNEFSDLMNSRQVPNERTATGQPLTQYHSLFYRLLSWKNPRATAITYVASVLFIFAARYLNILRYILKGSWIVFGITAAAEILGQVTLGNGFTSQIRPRKYFVIPRESLERFTEDIEQFINFFVIEFQRIVFAENVYVTIGAFATTLISYFLVKFVPLWGLALIGTTVLYFAPLIYIKNKDVIDAQLNNTANVIKQQSSQLRDTTIQSFNSASETARIKANEYTHKAQDLVGTASRKTSATYNQTAQAAKEKAGQTQQYASEKAAQAQDYAGTKANQGADYTKEKAAQAQDYTKDTYNQTADYTNAKANEAADYTKDTYNQTADYTNQKAGQAQDYTKDTYNQTADYTNQKAGQAQDYTKDTYNQTADYTNAKANQAHGAANDTYNSAAGHANDSYNSAAGYANEKTARGPDSVNTTDFPSAPREEPVYSAEVPRAVPAEY